MIIVPEGYITVTEAAEAVGVSVDTLRKWEAQTAVLHPTVATKLLTEAQAYINTPTLSCASKL